MITLSGKRTLVPIAPGRDNLLPQGDNRTVVEIGAVRYDRVDWGNIPDTLVSELESAARAYEGNNDKVIEGRLYANGGTSLTVVDRDVWTENRLWGMEDRLTE